MYEGRLYPYLWYPIWKSIAYFESTLLIQQPRLQHEQVSASRTPTLDHTQQSSWFLSVVALDVVFTTFTLSKALPNLPAACRQRSCSSPDALELPTSGSGQASAVTGLASLATIRASVPFPPVHAKLPRQAKASALALPHSPQYAFIWDSALSWSGQEPQTHGRLLSACAGLALCGAGGPASQVSVSRDWHTFFQSCQRAGRLQARRQGPSAGPRGRRQVLHTPHLPPRTRRGYTSQRLRWPSDARGLSMRLSDARGLSARLMSDCQSSMRLSDATHCLGPLVVPAAASRRP